MPDYVVAVDVGGTNIRAARVSNTGRISHRCETATPSRGGTAVIDAVLRLVERIPREDVRAIGVDVPGLAYRNGDVWAPNIRGWKRMPLGERLRSKLRLPVVVDSDRNAFVVGEAWKGAARDCSNVVFIAVGTGIGSGILVEGRLLRGQNELAGCVGWMAVRDRFLPGYEKVGCLESHAGGLGIGAIATRRLRCRITAQEATQRAIAGDPAARAVLRECGSYLGMAMANLVSTLNPQILVLGGGVAGAGELILAPAREAMRKWAQPLAARQTRVVLSSLGDAASLLGMARLALASVGAVD